jgi:hypothetical protein
MKRIFILSIVITMSLSLMYKTEQTPDMLKYDGELLYIEVGWGHPSPLQSYFQQKNLKYPFTMLHTGNYRGHVATWSISENKMFLTAIEMNGEKKDITQYNIKSENLSFNSSEKIFADWFNGILISYKRNEKDYWETDYYRYFYVRDGIILKNEKILEQEIERVQNMTENDTSNQDLMNKLSMLYLSQSYISYYFRLYDDESILIDDKKGIIHGKLGHSIILEYFDNDHMQWPYNWEKTEMNGAPNGTWAVINDKLYLTSINLYTGLQFDGAEKIKVDLSNIFNIEQIEKDKVFANWASGVYLVQHGSEIVLDEETDYREFKVENLQLLKINKGVIVSSRTVPRNINFKSLPKDTDEELKNLVHEYLQQ